MSCKVSIIIPVYNAAKHIKNMAQCLLNQTLNDIEFIFVNDASTDNTLEILSEIEGKDSERVIIINSDENLGPGGARNIAFDYANGEYIGFVDSDDLIKEDMFEILYNKANECKYDIVECGYYNERRHGNMMLWNHDMEGAITFEKRVKMFLSCGFICTKIFKRSLIIDNNIKFIHKIPLEDVDFLCRLYARADSLGIVNKSLYHYIDNKDSFSHTRNKQGFLDIYNIFCKEYLCHMKKEKIYLEMQPVIEYVVIDVWLDLFKTLCLDKSIIEKNTLSIIDSNLKKYIRDYNQNIFLVEKSKKDIMCKAFLINATNTQKAIEIINNM